MDEEKEVTKTEVVLERIIEQNLLEVLEVITTTPTPTIISLLKREIK